MATGYQITRPDTDQVKFTSERTGDHLLETYLQDAELGDRTLADLLGDLFNPSTGALIVNPTPEQITQSIDSAAAALASQQAALASQQAAAASVVAASGFAASIAAGPVFSVNGLQGVVVLPPQLPAFGSGNI